MNPAYPYIPIGTCVMCGEEVSLDRDIETKCVVTEIHPHACLARYAQEYYDKGKKMRVH